MTNVRVGLDVLRESGYDVVRGKRIGLLTHPAAVDSRLESSYRVLSRVPGVQVAALFGAEHGAYGAVSAGEKVATMTDPMTGIPIYSLYGDTLQPTPEMLENLDAVIVDLQDVGARFYTYTWTVSYVLEAASQAGVEVIILDRPNPLGDLIDGVTLEPTLTSFIGRFPEPIQHGMTLGEHAQLINNEWLNTPARLTVIPCFGLKRAMTWNQLGLPWVPTSPNMAQFSTVAQYPGACLVEGTNLSEGRGTVLPFEIVGAPFVDGAELADRLNAMDWIGIRFRPHAFTPAIGKWQGVHCDGVQVHVVEPSVFFPVRVWLGILIALYRRYSESWEWLPSFDRLAGAAAVREQIIAGNGHHDIVESWDESREAFARLRAPYLIYE